VGPAIATALNQDQAYAVTTTGSLADFAALQAEVEGHLTSNGWSLAGGILTSTLATSIRGDVDVGCERVNVQMDSAQILAGQRNGNEGVTHEYTFSSGNELIDTAGGSDLSLIQGTPIYPTQGGLGQVLDVTGVTDLITRAVWSQETSFKPGDQAWTIDFIHRPAQSHTAKGLRVVDISSGNPLFQVDVNGQPDTVFTMYDSVGAVAWTEVIGTGPVNYHFQIANEPGVGTHIYFNGSLVATKPSPNIQVAPSGFYAYLQVAGGTDNYLDAVRMWDVTKDLAYHIDRSAMTTDQLSVTLDNPIAKAIAPTYPITATIYTDGSPSASGSILGIIIEDNASVITHYGAGLPFRERAQYNLKVSASVLSSGNLTITVALPKDALGAFFYPDEYNPDVANFRPKVYAMSASTADNEQR
jgi:hypothetical protein